MCISEKVSWITLLLGSLVNLGVFRATSNKVILVWQYALLMQIPDALAWRNLNSTEMAGKLACFLNLTQPLATLAIFPSVRGMLFTIPYVINVLKNISSFKYDIKPAKNCSALNYQWWDKINPMFYHIAIMAVLFFGMKTGSTLNIIIFLGTLFLSKLASYGCGRGGWGSLWCWSVASAGLVNYLCA